MNPQRWKRYNVMSPVARMPNVLRDMLSRQAASCKKPNTSPTLGPLHPLPSAASILLTGQRIWAGAFQEKRSAKGSAFLGGGGFAGAFTRAAMGAGRPANGTALFALRFCCLGCAGASCPRPKGSSFELAGPAHCIYRLLT